MELDKLLEQFNELTDEYYNAALSYDKDKSNYNKHKLSDKADKVNSFRNNLSRNEFNMLRLYATTDAYYKNPALSKLNKIIDNILVDDANK